MKVTKRTLKQRQGDHRFTAGSHATFSLEYRERAWAQGYETVLRLGEPLLVTKATHQLVWVTFLTDVLEEKEARTARTYFPTDLLPLTPEAVKTWLEGRQRTQKRAALDAAPRLNAGEVHAAIAKLQGRTPAPGHVWWSSDEGRTFRCRCCPATHTWRDYSPFPGKGHPPGPCPNDCTDYCGNLADAHDLVRQVPDKEWAAFHRELERELLANGEGEGDVLLSRSLITASAETLSRVYLRWRSLRL